MRPQGVLRRGCRHALLALPSLVLVLAVSGALSARAGEAAGGVQRFLAEPGTAAARAGSAPSLPTGFHDNVAFSGLSFPTSVRFSPDGRVFVAEKSGLVKVFDSLSDPTPTVAVDLRSEVDDYWDRGLLGLALDPSFPTSPYVYLLYTYDAPPGRTAPVWNDACPTPPGPTTDGCVVSGRLIRVPLSGDIAAGSPQVLIQGQWCQQYPSHSTGDLAFGPDGKLYVSGGDGASFTFTDYGQGGGSQGSPTPANPCGDPPAGVGGAETAPTAEGGALRSQSTRRADGPALLNGTVLRVDPATGDAPADNPGSGDANKRRIIAYGLRNPFRFAFRPGTSELWIGDVGEYAWEEIDRRIVPTGAVQNFGWPCFEGPGANYGFSTAGITLCDSLYAAGSAAGPYYFYSHQDEVATGDGCPTANGSVVSALAFYAGPTYPSSYDGALVFGDHSRNCIWAMPTGANGLPDPSQVQLLVSGAANPVDIEPGPGGDLFYVDFDGGTIHRIVYSDPGCAEGAFHAEYFNNMTLAGPAVLSRCEQSIDYDWGDGSPSPAVDGDEFSARWTGSFQLQPGTYTFTATADDGIRVYVDGSPVIDEWQDQSATTYTAAVAVAPGTHQIRIEYYEHAEEAVAQVSWQLTTPDATPTTVIDSPAPTLTYAVGDAISFAGHATDPEDGPMSASALSWTLLIHHCTTPTACHVHNVQTWAGVAGGTLNAPDHGYPSHLELRLTATDSEGASTTSSVLLDPRTAELAFQTVPAGLSLTVEGAPGAAPFTRTVIVGSANSVSAPATGQLNGKTYDFSSWSDGGAATHNLTAHVGGATYTATYVERVVAPASTAAPAVNGVARLRRALRISDGTWSGTRDLAFAYQWLRCDRTGGGCTPIAGATAAWHAVGVADLRHRLRVRVTASNSAGSASADSAPTAVVAKAMTLVVKRRSQGRPRALHH